MKGIPAPAAIETKHLTLELPRALVDNVTAIAGRTGQSRLAWIEAALAETLTAAKWRLDVLNILAPVIAESQAVRLAVGEAYLAHDDATLQRLLDEHAPCVPGAPQ